MESIKKLRVHLKVLLKCYSFKHVFYVKSRSRRRMKYGTCSNKSCYNFGLRVEMTYAYSGVEQRSAILVSMHRKESYRNT